MKLKRIIFAMLISSIALSPTIKAHAQASDTPFQIKILSSTSQVDSVISVTNSGANGAGTTPGNTGATIGALCANFYAYSSIDGSLISCCSCPVGPNASRTLNVNVDLIPVPTSNTVPTKTVVKILASKPVSNSCNGSAKTVGTGASVIVTGLLATGTSVLTPFQVQPQLTISQLSESPFIPSTLSAGELSKMTSQCTASPGGGANKVCASCPN